MITLSHYLILAAILFVIGVAGVLMRRNVIPGSGSAYIRRW